MKKIIEGKKSFVSVSEAEEFVRFHDSEFEKRLASGDYDIAFTKITAQSEDAVSFLDMFNSSGEDNVARYDSVAYNSIMETTKHEMDQTKVFANCVAAEKHLIDTAVFIPMFHEDSYLGLAKGVSGIYCVEAGTVPVFIDVIRK